ncbi:hypothetical protein, partial [Vibrio vulnificus]|uniref:hypothetical protein n=3 Tax=Vibrio vulnificus TaxID=672 RepID=UPI000D4837A7
LNRALCFKGELLLMSYFLNIYEVDYSVVQESLSQGANSDVFASIVKSIKPHDACYIKKIFDKNYSRDPETSESSDANELIESFEQICGYFSGNRKTVIEFYLDEEEFPELFDFAFDDWDENDFELPLSPHGTPSVVYRNNASLLSYYQKLKVLLDDDFDEEFISYDDLSELVELISCAMENNQGLFVFCTQ